MQSSTFVVLVCLAASVPAAAVNIRSGSQDWVVALDKDMKTKMLVQRDTSKPAFLSGIKDPCAGITCGALECPAGFSEEEVEGHCCPYCVNPDIKLEQPSQAQLAPMAAKR